MDPKIVTLSVLALSILCLVREWLAPGLVALLGPLILVVSGVLAPPVFYQSFASPAAIAVAAMFVVSAALSKTGALAFVGHALASLSAKRKHGMLPLLMLSVAILSAFVNNTTIVLVLMPVILTMCSRLDQAPSRYLIPLSFASIFGGMLTLIGTTTNVLAAQIARKETSGDGQSPLVLGMWDFLPAGAIFCLFGILYMQFIGRRLLPDRMALSMSLGRGRVTNYVTEVEILAGSPWIGKTIHEWSDTHGLRAIQLIRGDSILQPSPSLAFHLGDLLIVKGSPERIVDVRRRMEKDSAPEATAKDLEGHAIEGLRSLQVTLAEVILPPGSRWIGRELQEIGLRPRYGVALIAVQRHGHHMRTKLGEIIAEPGDMLLVQGSVEALRNLRASDNMILIEDVEAEMPRRSMAPVALAILGAFAGAIALELVDLPTAALLAGCLVVLSRCITMTQAFNAVEWNVVLLLIGFIALGQAMGTVGIAQDIAGFVSSQFSETPLWLLVGAVYLIVWLLTEILSNTACAALMIPVVIKSSQLLGIDPKPLVMTVAYAASSSFCTPFGYQTNLLVFSAGGYRFGDYTRVGLPLNLAFIGVAMLVIPWIFG